MSRERLVATAGVVMAAVGAALLVVAAGLWLAGPRRPPPSDRSPPHPQTGCIGRPAHKRATHPHGPRGCTYSPGPGGRHRPDRGGGPVG